MPGAPEPFCIGSYTWPGLSKLIEELGENGQVLGKIIAFPGRASTGEPHPDGTNLKERLEDEIADLRAAIDYVVEANELDGGRIHIRERMKFMRFLGWHDDERARERTG
jgi:hypothetical protein